MSSIKTETVKFKSSKKKDNAIQDYALVQFLGGYPLKPRASKAAGGRPSTLLGPVTAGKTHNCPGPVLAHVNHSLFFFLTGVCWNGKGRAWWPQSGRNKQPHKTNINGDTRWAVWRHVPVWVPASLGCGLGVWTQRLSAPVGPSRRVRWKVCISTHGAHCGYEKVAIHQTPPPPPHPPTNVAITSQATTS